MGVAASSPPRPWESSRWRTDHTPPPAVEPSGTLGSTLGTLAIAVGLGVLGAYMLDFHGHTCEACGHRWHHLGAFNLGDASSHTCSKCGTVQWYKDGAVHVHDPRPHDPRSPASMVDGNLLAKLRAVGDPPAFALPRHPVLLDRKVGAWIP